MLLFIILLDNSHLPFSFIYMMQQVGLLWNLGIQLF